MKLEKFVILDNIFIADCGIRGLPEHIAAGCQDGTLEQFIFNNFIKLVRERENSIYGILTPPPPPHCAMVHISATALLLSHLIVDGLFCKN